MVIIYRWGGPGSISCGQYLDRTLGKFSPLYGPHFLILCVVLLSEPFDKMYMTRGLGQ